MKAAFIFIFIIGTSHHLFAQTIEQKLAHEVCLCLGEFLEKEEVEDKIRKCFPKALTKLLEEGNEEEKKQLTTVGEVQSALSEAKEMLADDCAVMRVRILANKKNAFYIPSSSEKANSHYQAGKEFLENGNYNKAAKKFKKAIKEDESFVLAIDHLANTFRKMEDFSSAIQYYKQSLVVFPEGEFALLHIADVYSVKNELDNALYNYQLFISLYPENAEGYFGLAKTFILAKDYDHALENLLVAHKMHLNKGSESVSESQQLISLLHQKYNDLNKNDIFIAKAEEHGIKISLNEK